VTLTWVAPSSNGGAAINGYNIYRGTASGSLSLLTNVGNVLTYTDSNLANGTRYYYQVTATNVAGESARSNERWGTPSTVAPEAPTNPVANGGYRSVVLTWNAPSSDGGSPVTGYKVFRGISSGSLTNIANLGNSLSYTDQNLANGTRYYYQVSAVNGMGEGARTVELSAMTSAVVPTQPMGLAAIAVGGGNISLTWSAPASEGGSAVTDYRIYRGTSSGSETFLASVGTQRSYLDSGLGYGQTLFYQVSATNALGEGGRSSEASASISSSLPSSPQNFVAFSGDSTVSLSWSAPNRDGGTPITGFRIYRGPIVGEESLLGSCVGLSYEDTTAVNGQTYFYKVSAVNSVGEGDCSNEASAMPFGLPHAPIDLEARASNGGASLTWAPPSDNGGRQITSYKIYRGDSPSSTVLLTSTGTGQEYQDSGLVNGDAYYYEVSAVSEIGEGARSQCASVTPGFVPTQPLNLMAMAGNARVSLTWNSPVEDNGYVVSSYSLYRAGADGAFSLLAGLGVTSSYVDNDVVNGEPYRYRVSAGNVFGEGAFSTECTATPMTAPSAPTEFTASGSTGQISLSWKMPLSDGGSKVSGFILLRGSQPATMVQLAQLGAVTSYVDRSLPKGTTYHYALRALNAAGSSDSAMASATTFDVPGAPQGVTVTNGLNAVVVQWSAPAVGGGSPISGYRIFRGGSPSDLSGLAYLSNGSSYSDSGLSPGITYYYAVAALNMVGEGAKSVPCSATTTVLPPSEPIAVKVKVSGNGLSVSWSAPVTDGGSLIIKYRVYRAAGDAPLSACADCIGLEYNDSAVGYGILYRYVIKALNAQGEGQPSLEAKGIVADAPDAVSGLQAVKGNGSVTLTWTVPDDGGSAITSYNIYRGLTLGTEVKIDTVPAKSTYVDSFPPKGQGAYYRVAAVNDVSEGAMSSAVFVSLLKKPTVVRDLRAEVSDGVVQLTWQPPIDDGGDAISGYTVYQAADTGNWQYLISVQTTHFKAEGLENGRTYLFSVAAINSMGQSESNSTIEAVPLGAPDAPGALTAVPYNGLVTLRWEAPAQNGGSPITGYRIYISQNGTYALVAAPDADAISFVCTGLLNGQDYLFSVSAVNGAGEGNRSLPSAATPFSGKAADVGGGSPSGSLVGGGMTTVMLAVTLSAAMIIILGFWSTTRNGRKNANGQTNKEEQTEMKEEKATQTSKPEAAAKPVGQPKGVKVDSAFEDSLRELEELESQL
jgi:fibronectin type 3 domain-containing protein